MGERLIVRKEDGVFTRFKAVYIEIYGTIFETLDEYSLVVFQILLIEDGVLDLILVFADGLAPVAVLVVFPRRQVELMLVRGGRSCMTLQGIAPPAGPAAGS